MPVSPEPLFDILAWDTEFFGFRIARARTAQLRRAGLGQLFSECRRQAVRVLYFLADPADIQTIQLLESGGFGLKDIRLTLSHSSFTAMNAAPGIRPATAEDLPVLRRIARQSHHDTRFYADSNFPRDRCDDLYDAWITNSCCSNFADAVLVGEAASVPAGYITCSMIGPRRGQIGLLAVAASARGAGLGRRLIHQALAWFAEKGVDEVITVTQAKNIPAVNAYERCGFIAASVQLWYHRWFNSQ